MTLKQSTNPYGYKNLLVYKKAEALQSECARCTSHFPPFSHSAHSKTISALADQMDRSARSVKQNIVEGWKRNSTKEYHQFLGFSLGANAELEEDCNDIIKGVYKGIEWEKGDKREKGEKGGNKNKKARPRRQFLGADRRRRPLRPDDGNLYFGRRQKR